MRGFDLVSTLGSLPSRKTFCWPNGEFGSAMAGLSKVMRKALSSETGRSRGRGTVVTFTPSLAATTTWVADLPGATVALKVPSAFAWTFLPSIMTVSGRRWSPTLAWSSETVPETSTVPSSLMVTRLCELRAASAVSCGPLRSTSIHVVERSRTLPAAS